ncbi:hypothetical protein [Lentzea aerocolonigenes]|uniref:hypothetical protein n=1 Tax=Lentzea aerocolonigenes TaxID=68170 RepID=UPI0004C37630|nr:hypothetical protein [Lentzea aerocolonigenes]
MATFYKRRKRLQCHEVKDEPADGTGGTCDAVPLEQAVDCLGEVVLPPEAVARLYCGGPERGFPADFGEAVVR